MTYVQHARAHGQADLIPVRMCNELVYCPRLFHLEHVQGIFVDSEDTVRGRSEHDRAAKRGRTRKRDARPPEETMDSQEDIAPPVPSRSLTLFSEAWGITGSVDLIETDGESVVAVETKHGRAPLRSDHTWQDHALSYRAWPADVAQLGLYMVMLRDAGLRCDDGRLYYRATRTHTTIPWSVSLEMFLRDVVAEARRVVQLEIPPEPLQNSPKCLGCSLHNVCMPDEHYVLKAEHSANSDVRRIVTGRDDRATLYVISVGSTVAKDGESVVVTTRTGLSDRVLIKDLSHVTIHGPSQVTEQCCQRLLASGIGISHHTSGGRLLGITIPLATRNIHLRREQYRAADDPERCLLVAQALVVAKIRNQRTVLKRYRRGASAVTGEEEGSELPDWASVEEPEAKEGMDARAATAVALRQMLHAQRAAERDVDIDVLRGHEGEAGAAYFVAFPTILPSAWRSDFCGRSRRPPRDRVNALLSFGYALLVRDAVSATTVVGLDPMLGFFHTMIPGRPALALDLMEPFRAAWVDTAVLRLLATRGIERDDFHLSTAGVMLSDRGRRALIGAYERRADELTTHPRFGYRMSYRRLIELEARILAKWLVGEIDAYTPLWTR